jgi:hypothetical protein
MRFDLALLPEDTKPYSPFFGYSLCRDWCNRRQEAEPKPNEKNAGDLIQHFFEGSMFHGAALMLGHRFHHATGFENRVSGVVGICGSSPNYRRT